MRFPASGARLGGVFKEVELEEFWGWEGVLPYFEAEFCMGYPLEVVLLNDCSVSCCWEIAWVLVFPELLRCDNWKGLYVYSLPRVPAL